MTRCRRASSRRLAFDCELGSGHTENCSPFTVRPNPAYHARPGGVMADHPSNPDLLMSRMLGVCWHSPTSDRWPCQVIEQGEAEIAARQWTTLDDALSYGPSCGCDQDPIKCNHEAALGEAEEKLRRVRDAIAEFEARAEAAKYGSTATAEDESEAMIEWGRYYGYAQAAKFLREAIQ